MRKSRFTWSLRSLQFLPIVLTVVPLFVILCLDARRQFLREAEEVESRARRVAAFVAVDASQILETTQQYLDALGSVWSTGESKRDDASHRDFLRDLASRVPHYVALTVAKPDGRVVCSVPETVFHEAFTPQLIMRAASIRELAMGEFHIDLVGVKDILPVAWAFRTSPTNEASIVLCAALDIAWMDRLLAEERVSGAKSLFQSGIAVLVIDRGGTILTRYPDPEKWMGRPAAASQIVRTILSEGQGTAEMRDVDGVRRFYAFEWVRGASRELVVAVGIPKAVELRAALMRLIRTLAAISLMAAALAGAAWYSSMRLIGKPVDALVTATHRIGGGDLTARMEMDPVPAELVELARAFDAMASALQEHESSRAEAEARMIEYDRQLRSLTLELSLVEDRERRQIAAALHDNVGQLLAAGFMRLGMALKSGDPRVTEEAVRKTKELLDKAIEATKSLTFEISSPLLYTVGLGAAIEYLCRDLEGQYPVRFVFEDRRHAAEVGADLRALLFRTVKELLFNAVKHSEGSHVRILVTGDDATFEVQVEDDGIGFDASQGGKRFSSGGGFGLFTTRERLQNLGGRMIVESSHGAGARISIIVPVAGGSISESAAVPEISFSPPQPKGD